VQRADALVIAAVAAVAWQQLIDSPTNHHGLDGWGPPMIALVLAIALREKLAPFAVPRWLAWLGDVSFSLYLVHLIAQHGLSRVVPHSVLRLCDGAVFVGISTALALALAAVSHRYLERGLAEWLRRRLERR
jgi:exopolysaccharide production protein ExoZ